ncbi:MAG: TrkH family potassium uptake protein [Limisphaerales bacterium]
MREPSGGQVRFAKLSLSWTQPIVRRKEVDLRLVPLGFLTLIIVGALLLMLPWAHRDGESIGWLDSFFLATSATCVTGLTTVNVAETFNGFGQTVLLFLIQAGGLGIFTASILLVLLSGQRLSLADEHTIHATVGKMRRVRPFDVFIYGCIFVLLFELAGTVALFIQINQAMPDQSVWQSLWQAAFHSVSAFCNAGISIFPDNLEHWRNQPGLLAVVEILVIAGGIGLMTLINLRFYYFWRRDPRRRGYLTLQTKLSLFMAALLLIAGTLVTLIFEKNHTLAGASFGERISWSFFHSTVSRTAGFNVVNVGGMNPPTLLFTLFLMFIGGAPGSMAGGVKTITFAVLMLTAWSALRRRENIQAFGRRISPQVAGRAVMISLIATAVLMTGVGLLMFTEQRHAASETSEHWLALIFEAVSAFGTVGLSAGVTPLLTAFGKLIIMLLMFTGRVMPLMLSIYLARPTHPWHVRRPSEEVGLG